MNDQDDLWLTGVCMSRSDLKSVGFHVTNNAHLMQIDGIGLDRKNKQIVGVKVIT